VYKKTRFRHFKNAVTRSTAFLRRSTCYCPVTTQDGSARRAKRWTPFTSPIRTCEKKQMVQPSMAIATQPRPKATTERRGIHTCRPPLARKRVAPGTYRAGVPRDGLAGLRALVPSREAARTRYNRQASLARHCLPDSLPARLHLRRGAVSATLTLFNTRQIRLAIHTYPTRATIVQ
jgi:hypothetical protein